MRKAALLFVLAIMLAATFAEELKNPALASAATITDTEGGTVTVTGGTMTGLVLNISVPISSDSQTVQYEETPQYDPNGNPFIWITEKSPGSSYQYLRTMKISTVARTTQDLPQSYIVPAEYSQFYTATSRTQSNNPKIMALAGQITENASDQFEKIALIAIWVNQHTVYDVSLVGQEQSAAWTLENGRGVCVEYSTLFAALARSINIPVKYVTGYAYSEKFGSWLGHAWNEAYIGKWVPVDSTWLEIGALDALHIDEIKQPELEKSFALTAYVNPPEAKINWDTAGRSGAFAENIQTDSVEYSEPRADFELKSVEPFLAPGESTLVYLKIKGSDYRVMRAFLMPCMNEAGEQSVTVDDNEQFIILKPNQTTVAVWEVHASSSLPAGYVYNCPLTLNSPYLERRTVDVGVNPQLNHLPDFSAQLEKTNIKPGEADSVQLQLPGTRRGKNYYVLTQNGIYQKRIDAGAGTMPFVTQTGPGNRWVYTAGEGGSYYKLAYSSAGEAGVSINNMEISRGLQEGVGAIARATISAKNYPADVSLVLTVGSRVEKTGGTITEPTEFEIAFVPASAGALRATLDASSGNANDAKSTIVTVAEQPKEETEAQAHRENETPAAGSPQQGAQANQPGACPLPLAILTVAFIG
ncbi:MAG: hypothetical protein NTV88_00515, partial [Candidatus Micrarchaeota archaeon]|nr:hypothetical protein [Candidatus Micrarchaeota archaeon]